MTRKNPVITQVSVSNRHENRAKAIREWLLAQPHRAFVVDHRASAMVTRGHWGTPSAKQFLTSLAENDIQVHLEHYGDRMRLVHNESTDAPYSVMFLEYTATDGYVCYGTENFTDVVDAFECFKSRIENKCPQWPSHIEASQISDRINIAPASQSAAITNMQKVGRLNREH